MRRGRRSHRRERPAVGPVVYGLDRSRRRGASAASTSITMPAANTTVTANFAANATYQLTVVNGTGSGTYTAGTVVAITANPAPAGMAFSSMVRRAGYFDDLGNNHPQHAGSQYHGVGQLFRSGLGSYTR